MTVISNIDLNNEKEKAKNYLQEMGIRVLVCAGTGCVANGSMEVYKRFQELGANVALKEEKYTSIKTGCHGFCEQGVLVVIPDKHVTYVKVKVDDVDEIVEKHLINNQIVERLLYVDPKTNEHVKKNEEINFYAKQERTSLVNCGKINPEDIAESIANDGYGALHKILNEMTPEQVCQEMIESGLRGRGGGGFPNRKKMAFCPHS